MPGGGIEKMCHGPDSKCRVQVEASHIEHLELGKLKQRFLPSYTRLGHLSMIEGVFCKASKSLNTRLYLGCGGNR